MCACLGRVGEVQRGKIRLQNTRVVVPPLNNNKSNEFAVCDLTVLDGV